MAFSCRIYLKAECDGCGCCEDAGAYHGLSRGRMNEDEYDPFEIDPMDMKEQ